MAQHSWIITDVENNIQNDDFHVSSADLNGSSQENLKSNRLPTGAPGNWKVTQLLLRGGLSEGVRLIEIDNGRMKLLVLPTRGMGIWKARLSDGQELGWQSPVRGPVHPQWVPIEEPGGLGWLEGFDELLVRCGLESNGEPDFDEQGILRYPLHGRIANRPAYRVELVFDDEDESITLRGFVEETRFHFQKLRLHASITTHLNSSSFTIDDQVENFGGTEVGMQMLYHMNVGEPFLGKNAQIVAPVQKAEPHDLAAIANTKTWDCYKEPTPGDPEQCFFLDLETNELNRTEILLKNASSTQGLSLQFDKGALPCFTVWKNMVAAADGYVTGLEPATNFPNKRSFEEQHGRVVPLSPGECWSAQVDVHWLTTSQEVNDSEAAIGKLLKSTDGSAP